MNESEHSKSETKYSNRNLEIATRYFAVQSSRILKNFCSILRLRYELAKDGEMTEKTPKNIWSGFSRDVIRVMNENETP